MASWPDERMIWFWAELIRVESEEVPCELRWSSSAVCVGGAEKGKAGRALQLRVGLGSKGGQGTRSGGPLLTRARADGNE